MYENQSKEPCRWCGGYGSDIHHLFERSTHPDLVTEPANLVMLCRRCHGWIDTVQGFRERLQERFFGRGDYPTKYQDICTLMQSTETITPSDCAKFIRHLAGDYGFLVDELAELERKAGSEWLEIRKTVETDGQATKRLDASETGKGIKILKLREKGLSRTIGALKTMLASYQQEAHNQF